MRNPRWNPALRYRHLGEPGNAEWLMRQSRSAGGSPLAEKGESVVVKATVKEHGERDGVKQTIIQRPTHVG